MSVEQNKALVHEHYRAFQDGDLGAIERQVTDDFTDHDGLPDAGRGPEAVKRWRAVLYRAFPDLQMIVDDVVAEGDMVGVRATWRGTHRGEFLRLPPTNRITLTGMVFWRIADGRLAERWATLDRFGLMQQLQRPSPQSVG